VTYRDPAPPLYLASRISTPSKTVPVAATNGDRGLTLTTEAIRHEG